MQFQTSGIWIWIRFAGNLKSLLHIWTHRAAFVCGDFVFNKWTNVGSKQSLSCKSRWKQPTHRLRLLDTNRPLLYRFETLLLYWADRRTCHATRWSSPAQPAIRKTNRNPHTRTKSTHNPHTHAPNPHTTRKIFVTKTDVNRGSGGCKRTFEG